MHEYLPHVKYDSGAIQVVLPQRLLTPKLRLQRPRSQREERILRQAILANSSTVTGISCKTIIPEVPKFEGVALFSSKFSHLNNGSISRENVAVGESENLPVHSHISNVNRHLMKAFSVYNTENGAQSLQKKNVPTRLLSRSQTNKSTVINSNHKGNVSTSNVEANRSISKSQPTDTNHSLSNNCVQRKNKNRLAVRSPFDTKKKTKKIYQSQKQSPNLTDGSEPSAPPGTPGPDLQRRYDFIPSMSDNLAKQQVKTKLKSMRKEEQEKERVRNRERTLQEARDLKEKEAETKKLQRRLIYMLNTEMTSVENKQFENFKAIHGLKNKQYPEPKSSKSES